MNGHSITFPLRSFYNWKADAHRHIVFCVILKTSCDQYVQIKLSAIFLFFIMTWSMSDFLWQYQYAIWKRDKSVIWKCYPDMITNSLTYLLTKKFMASRKKKVLRDLNTTRLRYSRVTIPCRAWRQTVVSRSHLRQLWLYRTLRYFFEGP